MRMFFSRLRARLRNRRFDDDLAEELRVHEEMKREEMIAAGLSPEEARSAARRALGNMTLRREDARRVWIAPWAESVVQDARYAVRTLVRQPLHTATVLAVLVLAIGLNSSLFTLLKGFLLTPWPGRNTEQVVHVRARSDGQVVGPSFDEFRFYEQHATSFSAFAAYNSTGGHRLQAPGRGEMYPRSAFVSASFLDVLGGRMHLGTGFVHTDDKPGQRPVAIISHFAWRHQFDSDPEIVGRQVTINGEPFTIIGVTERRLDGLNREIALWLPLSALAAVGPVMAAGVEASKSANCCISVVGRIRDGVNRARGRLEIQQLHERFTSAFQRKRGQIEMYGTAAIEGPSAMDYGVLGAVAAAFGLILVLACANVGNLQLARGLARRRELATRQAIGASRRRIVRQLLVEGLVLAATAGIISLALAVVVPGIVMRLLGDEIPPGIAGRFVPGGQAFVFTAAVCLVACIAFALAPALHATRATIPLTTMDRGGTRGTRLTLRNGLLAIQIAACTALLVGGGLLTRAIAHAMDFDPGYAVEGVTRVSVSLPRETPDSLRRQFHAQLLEALESTGEEVAVSDVSPVTRFPFVMGVALPGEQPSQGRDVLRRSMSARYFDVLGIPLVQGRMFASNARDEVVVNEAFVRIYRVDAPIGLVLREIDRKGAVARSHTVVGVVRDAYLNGFERIDPMIFRPTTAGTFMTAGSPEAIERVRSAALALHPHATVRPFPMTDDVREYLEESRVGAAFASAIGILGLLLASVGVFGVFAYAVEERRREIGIRLALGAARAQIVRVLISSSGKAMIGGLALGFLVSLACGPLLGAYLYGLSPLDPIAYAAVVGVLATTALLATLVPARRAIRVDPAVTLRED